MNCTALSRCHPQTEAFLFRVWGSAQPSSPLPGSPTALQSAGRGAVSKCQGRAGGDPSWPAGGMGLPKASRSQASPRLTPKQLKKERAGHQSLFCRKLPPPKPLNHDFSHLNINS